MVNVAAAWEKDIYTKSLSNDPDNVLGFLLASSDDVWTFHL